jgi:hypothetical protein
MDNVNDIENSGIAYELGFLLNISAGVVEKKGKVKTAL